MIRWYEIRSGVTSNGKLRSFSSGSSRNLMQNIDKMWHTYTHTYIHSCVYILVYMYINVIGHVCMYVCMFYQPNQLHTTLHHLHQKNITPTKQTQSQRLRSLDDMNYLKLGTWIQWFDDWGGGLDRVGLWCMNGLVLRMSFQRLDASDAMWIWIEWHTGPRTALCLFFHSPC